MTKWLLVLVAVAALTWWASRPSAGASKRGKPGKIDMKACPRCGVYVEEGGACDCGKDKEGE